MTETEASIALNMIPNLGPVRLRKLLECFDSPERILSTGAAKLRQVEGIGPEVANAIGDWQNQIDLSAELQDIRDFGAEVITRSSPVYPPDLLEIYNPPIVLYVWGKLTEHDRHAIGVVGSRKTSHYGLESAKKLAYQLAYSGLTVISGLARGIDTAAHQGALAAKGRTVAVLGSGLRDLYPPENQELASRIASSGAVVSEYPMNLPPNAQNFPYRNRIVAGWGCGLLVVEAGLRSGALITANQAMENGRLVYAVPGQIDRPTSAGSNRLIQQGAKLITTAGDILEDLHNLFPQRPLPSQAAPAATASAAPSTDEETVLQCLSSEETHLESLVQSTQLPPQRVSALLLGLEMKRLIKQLPGQQFVRL